jgi:hypothetical protein
VRLQDEILVLEGFFKSPSVVYCRYSRRSGFCPVKFSLVTASGLTIVEWRFYDPSSQLSALSTSGQHWLKVACLPGALPVALFFFFRESPNDSFRN